MTNEQTFDQIAREHDAMIKRIAMSYEARPHLAEDLVQEIYLAIWRALPSFRGDASLRTFVARIATNRAVTHVMRAVAIVVIALMLGKATTTLLPVRASEAARSLSEMLDLAIARARRMLLGARLGLLACLIAAVFGLAGTALRTYLTRPPQLSPIVDLLILTVIAVALFFYGRHVRMTAEKLSALKHTLTTNSGD
jgi:RNA polymerase sigma-70 factor, ECF subfamily